jgi:hypothetical protein
MNQQEIFEEIAKKTDTLSHEELKLNCATYLKIMQHLNFHSENIELENRKRERMRLTIAKRNINKWRQALTAIL